MLPQAKKDLHPCVQGHFGSVQLFATLQTMACRLLCQGAQAVASPPHLALTEADPSPPGKPQEQTPVHDPHAEVEIKPQLKSRGSMAKEEDPKPCTSCRLNPHDQLGRLCVYEIYERPVRAPTKENALVLIAVDIGGKNT